MRDDHQDIANVLARYRKAVFAKDAAEYISLYSADVVVFDMWTDWSVTGLEAWHASTVEWFGSLGAARVAVEVDNIRITGGIDIAVLQCFMKFIEQNADGVEVRSLNERVTWALKRSGDAWKVFHQHGSAPIGFDTKAIFDRSAG
jgi:uncharacterized protein (TIGR02246 family)